MTIKKQIKTLILFIAVIPLLCISIIAIDHYFNSTTRSLLTGTKKIQHFDNRVLSMEENQELFETLKSIPPHTESCVLTNDYTVIYTTISDLELDNTYTIKQLWNFINATSDEYFYQFNSIFIADKKLYILSRISRSNEELKRKKNITVPLLILISILITLCVLFIILIFNSILKSIITINDTALHIASGDLSQEISTQNMKFKKNEITSTLDSLEKMRISLLEEQKRKTKFIMGISHDLRTPVAIIKGYTEAISDGVISDEKELTDALNLVKIKTSQLENMIDSLINFMKLNNVEIRENLIPTKIYPILNSFGKNSKIMANVFKRTIITNISSNKDIVVPLNEQLFLRALENLFSNALRYTQDMDIIEINSYNTEEKLYIEIRDSGVGIAEKDLDYIFDIFYRGTNSRNEDGMGIGLSVVKNIISTHGWEIDVKSKKGKGSCFTIKIPINQ